MRREVSIYEKTEAPSVQAALASRPLLACPQISPFDLDLLTGLAPIMLTVGYWLIVRGSSQGSADHFFYLILYYSVNTATAHKLTLPPPAEAHQNNFVVAILPERHFERWLRKYGYGAKVNQ